MTEACERRWNVYWLTVTDEVARQQVRMTVAKKVMISGDDALLWRSAVFRSPAWPPAVLR